MPSDDCKIVITGRLSNTLAIDEVTIVTVSKNIVSWSTVYTGVTIKFSEFPVGYDFSMNMINP